MTSTATPIDQEKDVYLPPARAALCLEAAWELDALARLLPKLVTPNDEQEHLTVRGVAGRLLRLSSVLMSVLNDDEDVNEDEMAGIVRLVRQG